MFIFYSFVSHLEPSQRVGLHSGNATSFSLVNLEPFSSYKVWVSMITRAGESQSSDPILVNTTEAGKPIDG